MTDINLPRKHSKHSHPTDMRHLQVLAWGLDIISKKLIDDDREMVLEAKRLILESAEIKQPKTEVMVFDQQGDFSAFHAAQAWCKKNGYSYGSLARDMNIGLLRGDWIIAKWYNLTPLEIEQLHGYMSSNDYRGGPVKITIRTDKKEVQSKTNISEYIASFDIEVDGGGSRLLTSDERYVASEVLRSFLDHHKIEVGDQS